MTKLFLSNAQHVGEQGCSKLLQMDSPALGEFYLEGILRGLGFREICGDVTVSDRQDMSTSRASLLFWRSEVT